MAKGVESVYSHWQPLSQSQFNEIMLDFEKYCEDGSMIIDKNGQAVKFKLNEAQRIVADDIIREVFAEVPSPANLFYHKCRQMGISVVMSKLEQYIGTRRKNIGMQHVMPTEDDADDLFEKKFIPILQGVHPDLAPEVYKTERRLKFLEFGGVRLNSYINYSSSQKQSAGRGGTNQIVVEDEHAYYERVNNLERGLLATMPKAGLALRVILSTANGMNHFRDQSKVAEKSPHWKYRFLPWHMLAEYEMEPKGRLAELTNLTEYELFLCEIFEKAGYPVSSWARKMQWYEVVFQTEAKLDLDYMYENYPSVPEESFAATGAPVLPSQKLIELRDKEPAPKFDYVELTQNNVGKIEIKTTNLSTIRRFKLPIPGHKYEIWGDPADGGEQGDYSAAVVVDITTMEDVLSIKEKIDQNDFAELLSHIGRYYNLATIVIERNTGQSCIDWLVNIMKYPRVWIDAFATTANRVVYGVYMTRPAKSEAILRAKFLLNHDIYTDYDPDFIDDALHFVWKKTPSGLQKAVATDGYHDDTVMARLVGMATLNMKRWKEYQDGTKTGN